MGYFQIILVSFFTAAITVIAGSAAWRYAKVAKLLGTERGWSLYRAGAAYFIGGYYIWMISWLMHNDVLLPIYVLLYVMGSITFIYASRLIYLGVKVVK